MLFRDDADYGTVLGVCCPQASAEVRKGRNEREVRKERERDREREKGESVGRREWSPLTTTDHCFSCSCLRLLVFLCWHSLYIGTVVQLMLPQFLPLSYIQSDCAGYGLQRHKACKLRQYEIAEYMGAMCCGHVSWLICNQWSQNHIGFGSV